MTGAEYKTLRDLCGLTVETAAKFHSVSVRSIHHWEEGRNRVPQEKADEIVSLNSQIERGVAEGLSAVRELSLNNGAPDHVLLVRYRTIESYQGCRAQREGMLYPCHNAMIARLKLTFDRAGVPTRIVFSDEE